MAQHFVVFFEVSTQRGAGAAASEMLFYTRPRTKLFSDDNTLQRMLLVKLQFTLIFQQIRLFQKYYQKACNFKKSVMVDKLNTNLELDSGIEMFVDEYPYIFGILLIAVQ